jgi:hypothetical protein
VQLSNEVAIVTTSGNVTSLFNAWVDEDISNHNNSRYAYKLAGTDTLCDTNDDAVKVVSLGMDKTMSPLALSPVWSRWSVFMI